MQLTRGRFGLKQQLKSKALSSRFNTKPSLFCFQFVKYLFKVLRCKTWCRFVENLKKLIPRNQKSYTKLIPNQNRGSFFCFQLECFFSSSLAPSCCHACMDATCSSNVHQIWKLTIPSFDWSRSSKDKCHHRNHHHRQPGDDQDVLKFVQTFAWLISKLCELSSFGGGKKVVSSQQEEKVCSLFVFLLLFSFGSN